VDFQTRASEPYRQAMARLHTGVLGPPCYGSAVYECGRLGAQAGGDGPAEQRLRNWVFDQALSGDIIVEQNIHTLDVMQWMMQGPPVRATGTGGRKGRTDIGDCRDHFAVLFDYPDGVGMQFTSRQFGGWGTGGGIVNRLFGASGMIHTEYGGKVFLRGDGEVSFNAGSTPSIYKDGPVANLAAFHAAIRAGDTSNPTVAPSVESNLIAILGRRAADLGRSVAWEEIASDEQTIDGRLEGLKA
jgi:myo-inositol 2-dehydrogenase / D-chiro-inositol 1-dehydrogenase